MAGSNNTSVIEFLLVGLTDHPELQMSLFALFLIIYLVTMIGNVCMILLIQIDATLHTPMYFFLCNLALCDICYSTVLVPKMLINFLLEHKSSSFIGRVFQSFFFAIYITTEGLLLAIMAYDCYTAIVNPLLYTAIMTPKICLQVVLVCYLGGLANSLTHTIGLLRLDFCGPNVINHFFCDDESICSGLHPGHPHAKPPDLQPEEQGCEGGFEKVNKVEKLPPIITSKPPLSNARYIKYKLMGEHLQDIKFNIFQVISCENSKL
ncbi:olfactory receptor 1052-like [Tachyglossus aculeatus]|uniref:olfactory receptor 1052-like n=1 Tax=Tachyglossus aculeatus TaxID=9261 RepID=UPI0018F378F7|nr:olfactory receptor 1052-like [Tachyglossus aculeatus]